MYLKDRNWQGYDQDCGAAAGTGRAWCGTGCPLPGCCADPWGRIGDWRYPSDWRDSDNFRNIEDDGLT